MPLFWDQIIASEATTTKIPPGLWLPAPSLQVTLCKLGMVLILSNKTHLPLLGSAAPSN